MNISPTVQLTNTGTSKRGFTLVELMIVIIVIGILSAVVIFGVGDWRTRTATDEVKASLTSASSAMQAKANFSGTYPVTLPDSFTPSESVSTDIKSVNSSSYCIESRSKLRTAVVFHINSTDKVAVAGPC